MFHFSLVQVDLAHLLAARDQELRTLSAEVYFGYLPKEQLVDNQINAVTFQILIAIFLICSSIMMILICLIFLVLLLTLDFSLCFLVVGF